MKYNHFLSSLSSGICVGPVEHIESKMEWKKLSFSISLWRRYTIDDGEVLYFTMTLWEICICIYIYFPLFFWLSSCRIPIEAERQKRRRHQIYVRPSTVQWKGHWTFESVTGELSPALFSLLILFFFVFFFFYLSMPTTRERQLAIGWKGSIKESVLACMIVDAMQFRQHTGTLSATNSRRWSWKKGRAKKRRRRRRKKNWTKEKRSVDAISGRRIVDMVVIVCRQLMIDSYSPSDVALLVVLWIRNRSKREKYKHPFRRLSLSAQQGRRALFLDRP